MCVQLIFTLVADTPAVSALVSFDNPPSPTPSKSYQECLFTPHLLSPLSSSLPLPFSFPLPLSSSLSSPPSSSSPLPPLPSPSFLSSSSSPPPRTLYILMLL